MSPTKTSLLFSIALFLSSVTTVGAFSGWTKVTDFGWKKIDTNSYNIQFTMPDVSSGTNYLQAFCGIDVNNENTTPGMPWTNGAYFGGEINLNNDLPQYIRDGGDYGNWADLPAGDYSIGSAHSLILDCSGATRYFVFDGIVLFSGNEDTLTGDDSFYSFAEISGGVEATDFDPTNITLINYDTYSPLSPSYLDANLQASIAGQITNFASAGLSMATSALPKGIIVAGTGGILFFAIKIFRAILHI